jgi:hypothetical protein
LLKPPCAGISRTGEAAKAEVETKETKPIAKPTKSVFFIFVLLFVKNGVMWGGTKLIANHSLLVALSQMQVTCHNVYSSAFFMANATQQGFAG